VTQALGNRAQGRLRLGMIPAGGGRKSPHTRPTAARAGPQWSSPARSACGAPGGREVARSTVRLPHQCIKRSGPLLGALRSDTVTLTLRDLGGDSADERRRATCDVL
jgi:hypothetical protein